VLAEAEGKLRIDFGETVGIKTLAARFVTPVLVVV
jgi:hypothetical protein